MTITYVPVILNNAPVLNVDTLNATDINVSDDIAVTGDATVSGTFSGATGGFTGNFTVGGTTNVVNLNADVISAVDINVANSPAGTDAIRARVTNDPQPRFLVKTDGSINLGSGSAATDTSISRSGVNALTTPGFFAMGSGQSGGTFSIFGGSLSLGTAGVGLRIAEGVNARMGVATLVAGTVVVNNTSVTANTRIQLTIQSLGTVTDPKAIGVTARIAGTSFTIRSADVTDTSVIAWELKEPA